MADDCTRNFLPSHLQFAHDYSLFLHDILVSLIVEGEAKGIFSHQFTSKNDAHRKQLTSKTGEQLVEWMKENGYESEWR